MKGGENIKIINWLSGFMKPKNGETINVSTYRDNSVASLAIDSWAYFTVIEFIAGILSKCEIKTFVKDKEVRGYEWNMLNNAPNRNQDGSNFWNEIISKLLYQGEVVVFPVGYQLIIADTFSKKENAVIDNEYSELTRGTFHSNRKYLESDVFHFNYKASGAQILLAELMERYNKLIEGAADKYYKGTGEKGTLNISAVARGDADFKEKFRDLQTKYFASYFRERNAIIPLFEGFEYHPTNSDGQYTNEISDIKTLMDEALTRTAQVLRVPPAIIKGDTANIDNEVYRRLLTECLDPIAMILSRESTKKKFSPDSVVSGSRIVFDTKHFKHYDVLESGNGIEKLISNTVITTDEARKEIGMQPFDEWWSNKPIMTKNYAAAEVAMKGDVNNEKVLGTEK